jgi:hypothetical protein
MQIDQGGRGVTVFGAGEYLTGPSSDDPEDIAFRYVRAHAGDFGAVSSP